MRPHDDLYEALRHALGVVGELGIRSVLKRITQAQAILHKIPDESRNLGELQNSAKLIRGARLL